MATTTGTKEAYRGIWPAPYELKSRREPFMAQERRTLDASGNARPVAQDALKGCGGADRDPARLRTRRE